MASQEPEVNMPRSRRPRATRPRDVAPVVLPAAPALIAGPDPDAVPLNGSGPHGPGLNGPPAGPPGSHGTTGSHGPTGSPRPAGHPRSGPAPAATPPAGC